MECQRASERNGLRGNTELTAARGRLRRPRSKVRNLSSHLKASDRRARMSRRAALMTMQNHANESLKAPPPPPLWCSKVVSPPPSLFSLQTEATDAASLTEAGGAIGRVLGGRLVILL